MRSVCADFAHQECEAKMENQRTSARAEQDRLTGLEMEKQSLLDPKRTDIRCCSYQGAKARLTYPASAECVSQ